MKRGKRVCETLTAIRCRIAEENEIEYKPLECHNEDDCDGTCPVCEREVRWLENMLRHRQSLGKAVTVAGLSVALGSIVSSCQIVQPNGYLEIDTNAIERTDSAERDSVDSDVFPLKGDSTAEAADSAAGGNGLSPAE